MHDAKIPGVCQTHANYRDGIANGYNVREFYPIHRVLNRIKYIVFLLRVNNKLVLKTVLQWRLS